MPRKPKKPCAFPGCPNLTDGTYCAEHEKLARRRYDAYRRDPDVHKTYGRAWRRIQARYAAAHPLCKKCLEEGRATLTEEVHRILPVSRGGTHDAGNLMSLRRSCHNKIHLELVDRHTHG